jgi:hypothetical protein
VALYKIAAACRLSVNAPDVTASTSFVVSAAYSSAASAGVEDVRRTLTWVTDDTRYVVVNRLTPRRRASLELMRRRFSAVEVSDTYVTELSSKSIDSAVAVTTDLRPLSSSVGVATPPLVKVLLKHKTGAVWAEGAPVVAMVGAALVGTTVGANVGCPGNGVGRGVGSMVGTFEGLAVGFFVGLAVGAVGARVGSTVGAVGAGVGTMLGANVDSTLGAVVGYKVGGAEGATEGAAEGSAEGSAVGSALGSPASRLKSEHRADQRQNHHLTSNN